MCDVPLSVLQDLPELDTYIMYGEAFGPLLAMYFLGERLASSSVVFFIDNLSVLSCFVMGKSQNVDLSTPVYTVQFFMAKYNITVWFEYIDSKTNVSDGGSRIGNTDPVCRSLGIH